MIKTKVCFQCLKKWKNWKEINPYNYLAFSPNALAKAGAASIACASKVKS